ncbi:MAG: type II toxin-antitoxin system Phd/YefM family antitoxin [Cardiobacterium sp.]|jgi:hypothetical protein
MNSISSNDLKQNLAKAKQLAANEPLLITAQNEPSYVLMSYAAYQQLYPKTNAERVGMRAEDALQIDEDFAFERITISERETDF